MAFLAHKMRQEAATYTKAAGRAQFADSGMSKLPSFHELQDNRSSQAIESKGE
ncbi:hypothetical protein [Paracoccus sp. MKU1]|uniref:hypothetical protein n=1 Tax=Paracoccus sp. MKU1 TaxID=1745182 RepID=UPI000A856301|nr:hypothetical protein [Paracoccus sp. MKU1]